MQLLDGLNHIAVMTADLDRFVGFYSNMFGAEVIFSESTPAFRHAILRTGTHSWLHPVQIDGNDHTTAVPAMFRRGHIDHLALAAASPASFAEIRARLITAGASDGTVEDLGPFQSIWFQDPDGMRAELTVIFDAELRGIHEPRPLR